MIIISEPAGKILVKTVYKKVPNSYEENKEGHFWLSFSFTLSQKLNRCHKCSTAFSRFRCSRTGGCQVSSVLVRDSCCFKWIDLFLGFQVERLLRFSSTVVAALAPKFSFNHGGCFVMETAVELALQDEKLQPRWWITIKSSAYSLFQESSSFATGQNPSENCHIKCVILFLWLVTSPYFSIGQYSAFHSNQILPLFSWKGQSSLHGAESWPSQVLLVGHWALRNVTGCSHQSLLQLRQAGDWVPSL